MIYNDCTSENDKRFKFAYDTETGNYGALIDGEYYFFGGSSGIDISDTTATANVVLSGYDFYLADGTKTSGEIVTRSASSTTVVGTQTYYSGYYPNEWTVSGLNTNDATAYAKNIEAGFTAYCRGSKITGTASVEHSIVKYAGSVEYLLVARRDLAAASNSDYALFGGGHNGSRTITTVDAYNTSLSRSTPSTLSANVHQLAATNVGDYALFGGGENGQSYFDTVNAYDTSLSRSNPTYLSQGRYLLAATSIGNYALFGGGRDSTSSYYKNTVDAYNTSLSRSTPTVLSVARQQLVATKIGNYALFGGGSISANRVDAYDNNLIRSTPTGLSQARYNLAATSIGDYALFGGGLDSSASNTVDAYVET